MTKTLNQIIFFFPPPKSEYFFQKKNITFKLNGRSLRTVFLFSQNLVVNSFDIIPFISNIYKMMYKEQHAELLRIVVMHLKCKYLE